MRGPGYGNVGPMGLVIWDEGDDQYDHTQLTGNWDTIEAHDHSPGKGVPITGAGIADGSISGSELAPNSVTTTHIVDGTIQSSDIGNGQVGFAQLNPSIFDSITPLGTTTAWFRPNATIPVPSGWVISTGQTLASTDHGWTGVGNVTLPDLRNRFILGAATTGTGTAWNQPPAEKAVGGSNSRTFSHTHTVPGHSHSVDAHHHTVNNHAHGIMLAGAHNHGMHTRTNAVDGLYYLRDVDANIHATDHQSLYVAGLVPPVGNADGAVPGSGDHNHGGATDGASPDTNDATSATNSVGLTTDPSAPGGDIRPAFVGLLYIIKVKHG